jgi:multisubunit Na+/H+ antiporter MnhC subunit
MPLPDILILTGIVVAFVAFAATVAYGDYQTRHLERPSPTRPDTAAVTDFEKAA